MLNILNYNLQWPEAVVSDEGGEVSSDRWNLKCTTIETGYWAPAYPTFRK